MDRRFSQTHKFLHIEELLEHSQTRTSFVSHPLTSITFNVPKSSLLPFQKSLTIILMSKKSFFAVLSVHLLEVFAVKQTFAHVKRKRELPHNNSSRRTY